MREIEQAGLLGSLLYFHLQLVAGVTKLSLDAASNGAEPCDQRGEGNENDEVWKVGECEKKAVKGLGEEVVEASAGQ